MSYQEKYLKYKLKYLNLKKNILTQNGGQNEGIQIRTRKTLHVPGDKEDKLLDILIKLKENDEFKFAAIGNVVGTNAGKFMREEYPPIISQLGKYAESNKYATTHTTENVLVINKMATIIKNIYEEMENGYNIGLANKNKKFHAHFSYINREVENGINFLKVTKALSNALQNNPTLEKFYLEHNKIGDEGAKALAEALTKPLGENQTLTKLNLDNNDIGDEGAKALAESLKVNDTLTKLDLDNNDIGDEGAKALAEALKENKKLKDLNLEGNKTSLGLYFAKNEELVVQGRVKVSNFDSYKMYVQFITGDYEHDSIDLSGCDIGDEDANELAEALRKNQTLTSLDLYDNNIGDEGAKALAKALDKNQTLEKLYLESNKIGDEGTKALAKALDENQKLASLHLESNNIRDEGADALAKALQNNKILERLYLDNNNIRDEGADALAKALQNNQTLTTLYLKNNNIENAGADALAKALQNNQTLTDIYIYGNPMSESLQESIKDNIKARANKS